MVSSKYRYKCENVHGLSVVEPRVVHLFNRRNTHGVFTMVGRITVTKARRILGEMAASLNDVEIQEMLDVLELMAADILQYNSSKEEENSNGIITSESED